MECLSDAVLKLIGNVSAALRVRSGGAEWGRGGWAPPLAHLAPPLWAPPLPHLAPSAGNLNKIQSRFVELRANTAVCIW